LRLFATFRVVLRTLADYPRTPKWYAVG
jgi:hypothetical protein